MACFLAGPALAQPNPKLAFIDYMTHDAGVPADIEAEVASFDGSSSASCRLVDWVLAPATAAPPSIKAFGATLSPACQLPVADIDPGAADKALGAQRLAMSVDGDVVTVLQRSAGPQPPWLCCSLQGPMRRLGSSDVWALRFRLRQIDEALLTFSILGSSDPPLTFRGPRAPAAPALVKPPLSGRLTMDSLYSPALGETRKLDIYIPKGEPPPGGWPTLFLADGGAGPAAQMIEALVEAGRMSPIAIVGVLSGQPGIVEDRSALGIADLRSADDLRDYPGGGGRFERHMTFLSRELPVYVRAKYGVAADPAKIAVSGASNGGQLAFEAGVLHPEVFGFAIPCSAGWKPVAPDLDLAHPRARFYASAGAYEDAFMRSTSASVDALEAAGYQAQFRAFVAGHMRDQWDVALADALTQAFPAGA